MEVSDTGVDDMEDVPVQHSVSTERAQIEEEIRQVKLAAGRAIKAAEEQATKLIEEAQQRAATDVAVANDKYQAERESIREAALLDAQSAINAAEAQAADAEAELEDVRKELEMAVTSKSQAVAEATAQAGEHYRLAQQLGNAELQGRVIEAENNEAAATEEAAKVAREAAQAVVLKEELAEARSAYEGAVQSAEEVNRFRAAEHEAEKDELKKKHEALVAQMKHKEEAMRLTDTQAGRDLQHQLSAAQATIKYLRDANKKLLAKSAAGEQGVEDDERRRMEASDASTSHTADQEMRQISARAAEAVMQMQAKLKWVQKRAQTEWGHFNTQRNTLQKALVMACESAEQTKGSSRLACQEAERVASGVAAMQRPAQMVCNVLADVETSLQDEAKLRGNLAKSSRQLLASQLQNADAGTHMAALCAASSQGGMREARGLAIGPEEARGIRVDETVHHVARLDAAHVQTLEPPPLVTSLSLSLSMQGRACSVSIASRLTER
ncbi:hypothetical protein CYMTET_17177 [Cymbomonas tetramitiformis]|uniref:Uncharacterized protein n=1 Tax=Cymbomonas tetramitiformis TaxID=36881 RepID=A0AAE0GAM3_9CHLO|nr:hypothetical protein CYMTET_17177 [Cymbomonas tetramitiformis]